jgi:hypothetical protein
VDTCTALHCTALHCTRYNKSIKKYLEVQELRKIDSNTECEEQGAADREAWADLNESINPNPTK